MSGFSCNYQNNITGVALNDLYLDSAGNITNLPTGNTEIEETCYHAIQLCMGDYDFNIDLGTAYNTYIEAAQPMGNALKQSIAKAVLAVSGVQSIDSFTLNLNRQTRVLYITMVIDLTNGGQIGISLP